jgi:hypothetical protein
MPLFSEWNIMLVGWLPLKNRPPSERQALCIIRVNTVAKYTSIILAEVYKKVFILTKEGKGTENIIRYV